MRCGFAPHIIRHSRPNWAPSNQLFHCKILWWIRTTSLTYLLLEFTYSSTHQIANHGFEPLLPYKSFHQPSCWPWYLTSRASTLLDMHNTPYWQRPFYVYEDCIGFTSTSETAFCQHYHLQGFDSWHRDLPYTPFFYLTSSNGSRTIKHSGMNARLKPTRTLRRSFCQHSAM